MVSVSAFPAESLGPGDTVLLSCPVFDPDDETACADLLTPEGAENVLSVTIAQSPGARMAIWQRQVGVAPADGSIITFDRSGDGSELPMDRAVGAEDVRLRSAGDITGLGVRITEQLTRWSEDSETGQIVVCFHSVSALLQLVGRDEGIQFCKHLAERCRAAGAIAHYHMDPRAHSEETVARMRNVVDIVYEHDGERWERTRP